MKLNFAKKNRYVIHALLATLSLFMFSRQPSLLWVLVCLTITLAGTFIVQYPNNQPKHFLINNLLPLHLITGALLAIYYFPNLGLIVRLFFIGGAGLGFYIVSLINNIFLVVEEKKEIIPLYRAAVTWSQIVFVVIAIPFFAGVFKIPVNALGQSLIAAFSALLFAIYLIWMLQFDSDSKRVRGVEYIIWGLVLFYMVFVSAISVSFIPSESFLKALFVASVLMFGLNFVFGYLKNNLTKRSVIQYFLITFVFFIILAIFRG
jgi:hypothetical protein